MTKGNENIWINYIVDLQLSPLIIHLIILLSLARNSTQQKLWAEVGLNTDTLVYNEQKIFSGSSFQERNVNTNITNWEKRGIYINDTTLPIMF